ncbi:MAG TPA: hypothetical protein VF416_01395 [Marmoricola sp.]
MDVVEATSTPRQRQAGLAWVPWRDVADQQGARGERVRPLAPGERVVLHLDGHAFHRGQVLRYDDAGAAYLITIGAPMARRSAARLVGAAAEPEVQDVEVRVVPAQRSARVSLYL